MRTLAKAALFAGMSAARVPPPWDGLACSRHLGSAPTKTPRPAVTSTPSSCSRTWCPRPTPRGGDKSVQAFLESLDAGEYGPGDPAWDARAPTRCRCHRRRHGGARVRHGGGDGVTEENFPSVSRPEPMFDLAVPRSPRSRTRPSAIGTRLEDERRLFDMVVARASGAWSSPAPIRTPPPMPTPSPAGPGRARRRMGTGARRTVRGTGVHTGSRGRAGWHEPATPVARAGGRLAALRRTRGARRRAPTWARVPTRLDRDRTRRYRRLPRWRTRGCPTWRRASSCTCWATELGLGRPGGVPRLGGQDRAPHHRRGGKRGEIPSDPRATAIEALRQRWRPAKLPIACRVGGVPQVGTRVHAEELVRHLRRTSPRSRSSSTSRSSSKGSPCWVTSTGSARWCEDGTVITDYKTGKSDNAGPPQESLQLGIDHPAVQDSDVLADYEPVCTVELAFLRGNWVSSRRRRHPQLSITERDEETYEAGTRERLSVPDRAGRRRSSTEIEVLRPNLTPTPVPPTSRRCVRATPRSARVRRQQVRWGAGMSVTPVTMPDEIVAAGGEPPHRRAVGRDHHAAELDVLVAAAGREDQRHGRARGRPRTRGPRSASSPTPTPRRAPGQRAVPRPSP